MDPGLFSHTHSAPRRKAKATDGGRTFTADDRRRQGDLLHAWRAVGKARRLSQKELAGLCGKSQGAISQFLNGHTALNAE